LILGFLRGVNEIVAVQEHCLIPGVEIDMLSRNVSK